MQRFLRNYTPLFAGLFWAVGVCATEPATDRYGRPSRPVLEAGEWWKAEAMAPEQAAGRAGEFAMVRGTVLDVYKTREDWYLNFGPDYKTDFTVRIPKRAWKQFGEMKGKAITVRGVLRDYNGPMIVVDRKEQLHAE